MIQPFSAAAEFGFPNSWSTDASDGGQTSTAPSTEPRSVLPGVEAAAGTGWSHPGLAVWGLLLVGAGVLAHATKPLAGGKVAAHVGPAKGSIEGEL